MPGHGHARDDIQRRCVRTVCRRTPPTSVHAGAWTVTNGLFPQQCTEDTYTDLRGAKYRSDKCVPELHTHNHTFCVGAQVSGPRDLPQSHAYGCYYVLTDALVAHIEVHTTTTWCRAPASERCLLKKYAGARSARCNTQRRGVLMACRRTPPPRPGRCMNSTHPLLHLISSP